jgi:hypothetical protein
MVDAVKEVDPEFFSELQAPYPLEETVEFQFAKLLSLPGSAGTKSFIQEFDAELGGLASKLVDYKVRGEETLARSLRHVLGLPSNALSDAEALDMVLNPKKNPYFSDVLNLTTISKITRTMFHPHYTFQKKISHTADSQDQRHRMTPASRPCLEFHYCGEPDYVTPILIQQNEEALEVYTAAMRRVFNAINDLVQKRVPLRNALYLLPNAFPVRFEESADLLNLHHKWRMRTCYNAQEEIFHATLQEIRQISEIHPVIARYAKAPCWFRKESGITPFCPEKEGYCGVPVWNLELDEYRRLI